MCFILLTLIYAAVTDDVDRGIIRNMEGTRIAFGLNPCPASKRRVFPVPSLLCSVPKRTIPRGAVCFRSVHYLAHTLSRTITMCISTASDCPRMIDHAHRSHGPEQAISFSSVHMDVRSQDGHSTLRVLHPTITRLAAQVRRCPRNWV